MLVFTATNLGTYGIGVYSAPLLLLLYIDYDDDDNNCDGNDDDETL